MNTVVKRNSAKYFELYVDGQRKQFAHFYHDKRQLAKHLKENYNIDLRTDKTIIRKGYKEFTTKKVARKNGIELIIKAYL